MRRVVISPHPDDELIGAYKILKKGVSHVVYLTKQRLNGIKKISDHFGFTPVIYDLLCSRMWDWFIIEGRIGRMNFILRLKKLLETQKEVFVPSILDGHPDHVFSYLLITSILVNAPVKIISYSPYFTLSPRVRKVRLWENEYADKLTLYKKFYPGEFNKMKKLKLEIPKFEVYQVVKK